MGILALSDKHTLRFKMLLFSLRPQRPFSAPFKVLLLAPATLSAFRGTHATARLLPSPPQMCHNRLWKQSHE